MLNIVVLNVGISQQLFDVRTFSDNLFSLFNDGAADTGVTELWYAECLLVFAIGRLLQPKWDDMSKPPGDEFFHEALKRIPDLSSLRKQGVLGIELMGLSALYLQIADRKDDAYLYVSNPAEPSTLPTETYNFSGEHSPPSIVGSFSPQVWILPKSKTFGSCPSKPALVVYLHAGTVCHP